MESPPEFRGVASRLAARVTGSRFAAPAARAALAAAGVVLLAIIGYAAGPRGLASSAAAATATSAAPERTRDEPARPSSLPASLPPSLPSSAPVERVETAHPETPPATAGHGPHVAASADDPVVLNTATTEDFRRLPGIGEKRAAAMIALRDRLGRFRAVEDLLKVKGVGRAMLKRLRPLVRLDPHLESKAADGGASTPLP